MRRIVLWLAATVAVLVLVFSYRTSVNHSRAGSGPPAAPAGIVRPDPSSTGRTVTVNGTSVPTRWGPVQVQLKIVAGRITDIAVLQRPTGSATDEAINGYALPQLRAQALAAQSANIAGVSGATVTTGGYVRSLQAAIDAAKFVGTPTGTPPPVRPVPSAIGQDDD